MQTTTTQFATLAQGQIRPISHDLRISFDKAYDDSITFFTLDTSILDGIDLLAPDEANVIAEWDKYEYDSYSDRAKGIEWQREELFPYSVAQAMADVTLNNYDGYFTKDAGSPIDAFLLPQRPLRILAGFGGINIPQFVGLTDSVPVIDNSARTVKVHCQDFLSFIFNKPLDQALVYENYFTSEVLDALFQYVGLSPNQYALDESFNQIGFVYFEKGSKLGDAVKRLMQAELGSLFMDEAGMIRFRNRLQAYTSPVYQFDEFSIIDYTTSQDSQLINVVEVKSDVRVVQPLQAIYTLISAIPLVGNAPEIFLTFDDPITYISPVISYLVNELEDGSGTNLTSSVTIDSIDLFNTAAKITFDNPAGGTVYLTSLNVAGTPAKVVRNIYLRIQDDDSVEKYEEQIYTIQNDFVQDNSGATSLALSILNLYKEYSSGIEIEVKGSPALQLGDTIEVTYKSEAKEYIITKITNIRVDAKFTQRLTARNFNTPQFFTLDVSTLDGTDVLAI